MKTSDMTTAVVLMYEGPSPVRENRIVRMTADVCTMSRIRATYLYGTKMTPTAQRMQHARRRVYGEAARIGTQATRTCAPRNERRERE